VKRAYLYKTNEAGYARLYNSPSNVGHDDLFLRYFLSRTAASGGVNNLAEEKTLSSNFVEEDKAK